MKPPCTLYRRQGWAGVTPPKFPRKTPVVGSSSHHRTWETRHPVEHLMKCCGLRSIRNNYKTLEATPHVGKAEKRVESVTLGSEIE